jgi:S-adenosylmethionine hydrolase
MQSSRTSYSGIVTFLTDFGTEDGYVGVMKGVVLSHAPCVRLVDITHHVPRFSVSAAALILENSFPSFPKGTIHVMVVDPGVGSSRRHLFCKGAGHFFIGPDNGVLGRIAERNDGSVFEINPDLLGVIQPSATFHGRDIYALAAAKLLCGLEASSFSTPISDPQVFGIPEPRELKQGLEVEVIYVDHFGNLVTNLRHLPAGSFVHLGRKRLRVAESYFELEPGKAGLVLDSWGYYEIALREDSAACLLGIGVGEKVLVKL